LNINKVAAVIPFFNEEERIAEVVSRTSKYVDLIIVVDDGSNDGSRDKLKSIDVPLIVVENNVNEGKGSALNKGFLKSIELKTSLTITLDADLQHPPEFIPEFIQKAKDYDIVIGNRKKSKSEMPLQRRCSNKITSLFLSMKTGYKILDSQCGYRVYKTEILKSVLPSNNGFEAESEIIVNAAKQSLKIGFITIPTIYGTEKSKIRPFRAIIGFLKVLFFK
jgi:glycosyltransferase involved in cell wall biosynthesis